MTLHDLRLGKIVAVSAHIAEVIIDDGVVLDELLVDEYHQFLRTTFNTPIYLLVNKINRYAYTLAAQKKLAVVPESFAISVVVYYRISELSTVALISIPRAVEWNILVFHNRRQALEWLEQQQAAQSILAQVKTVNSERTATICASP